MNFVAHTDCTACLQTECCGAIGECFSDEECLSCWNSPNDSCRRRLDHIATQTCGAERCGELCNSPVDYCPGFFVADQTACSDCIQFACCEPAVECNSNPDCRRCIETPSGPGCDALLEAYQSCVVSTCSDFCG
ncbi:MAG: hypothetical protein AAFU77_06985 [Myxococcota bacterium]